MLGRTPNGHRASHLPDTPDGCEYSRTPPLLLSLKQHPASLPTRQHEFTPLLLYPWPVKKPRICPSTYTQSVPWESEPPFHPEAYSQNGSLTAMCQSPRRRVFGRMIYGGNSFHTSLISFPICHLGTSTRREEGGSAKRWHGRRIFTYWRESYMLQTVRRGKGRAWEKGTM